MNQIDRAKRYLDKIRAMYDGFIDVPEDRDHLNDEVLGFFIHCYHIRDWIIALSKIRVTRNEIDAFINAHEPLKICADLCNASKHCHLNRTRTKRQPHICYRQLESVISHDGPENTNFMKCRFEINTDSGAHDALELAEKCMDLWNMYTDRLREAYNLAKSADVKKLRDGLAS